MLQCRLLYFRSFLINKNTIFPLRTNTYYLLIKELSLSLGKFKPIIIMKRILLAICMMAMSALSYGQSNRASFTFARLSDVHLNSFAYAEDDLRQSIEDINANPAVDFTILSGDVTEFGDTKEFPAAAGNTGRLQETFICCCGKPRRELERKTAAPCSTRFSKHPTSATIGKEYASSVVVPDQACAWGLPTFHVRKYLVGLHCTGHP